MEMNKLILGLVLFLFGLAGIMSVLTLEIPIPLEAEAILSSDFSPMQIKLLMLINPIIMLIVAVTAGIFLYEKVNLHVPIFEWLISRRYFKPDFKSILKHGIVGGLIAGILISLISLVFYPMLPEEFLELGEKLKPGLAARFLYGGITEEILMRFGLMTFIVWIAFKIVKEKRPQIYWTGIIISALIFAVGHFPVAFYAVGNPSLTLLVYILLGNTIGGIIFGYLYWKRGLESAFIAHIFAHVAMLMAEPVLKL
jgi:membrane protease YdiL (CAAX protease family)